VAAGVCIRLYDEAAFSQRSEQTDPEILRTNLASVILQMASLGLGDVAKFPFMNPPELRSISDGYRLLHELQAVDDQRKLTSIGRKLVRLPVAEFVSLQGKTGMAAKIHRVEDVGRHKIVRAKLCGQAVNMIAPEGTEIATEAARIQFKPDAISVFVEDWRLEPGERVQG